MAALVEPVVGAFTATWIGVGVLPGVEGWIGNFLVIVGTLAVLYPTTPQYQAEQQKHRKRKELLVGEASCKIATSSSSTTPRRTPYPRMRTPRLQHHRPNPKQRREDGCYEEFGTNKKYGSVQHSIR